MRVIDSHTEGEPTRVIVAGGPDLGSGSVTERAKRLEADHSWIYAAALAEPRGHDAMVGALLVPPADKTCAAGAIFFNTVGNLGMCGHASIGLAVTLAHLGEIGVGSHRFETPVGVVTVDLLDPNTVRMTNVESYRYRQNVQIDVEGVGPVVGDVAWGGNWFFLTNSETIAANFDNIPALTSRATAIREALEREGIAGENGAQIDHIELFGPPHLAGSDSRNFVLCPGGAYDRSPCGTGCSAAIACKAADAKLRAGEVWVQESIIGSTYKVSYEPGPTGGVIATIEGRAYVTAQAELLFAGGDPFRNGIRPT